MSRGGTVFTDQQGRIRPVDVFLLALLFVLVIGGVLYFFRSASPVQMEATTPALQTPYNENETALNVYTLNKHGISLLYPSTWTNEIVAEERIADIDYVVQFYESAESKEAYSVLLSVMNDGSIDETVASTQATEMLFNGRTAYEYTQITSYSEDRVVLLEHPLSGKWISIRMTAQADLPKQTKDELHAAFSLIVESLRTF